MTERSISIGSGSAWSDDRLDWAAELADSGLVDYMGFDCLAERTMALAQIRRINDETTGQDQRIPELMWRFAGFLARGGKMVGNFGAANPDAAADDVLRGLRTNDVSGVRVGVIRGERKAREPRVIVDMQNTPPRLAAIGGLVHAAIAAA